MSFPFRLLNQGTYSNCGVLTVCQKFPSLYGNPLFYTPFYLIMGFFHLPDCFFYLPFLRLSHIPSCHFFCCNCKYSLHLQRHTYKTIILNSYLFRTSIAANTDPYKITFKNGFVPTICFRTAYTVNAYAY